MRNVIVPPEGPALLTGRIRQINAVLGQGSEKARLEVPEWYDTAMSILYRDSYLVLQVGKDGNVR